MAECLPHMCEALALSVALQINKQSKKDDFDYSHHKEMINMGLGDDLADKVFATQA